MRNCTAPVIALMVAGGPVAAAPSGAPTACARLETVARSVTPQKWNEGAQALAPALAIESENIPRTDLRDAITSDRAVRQALGDYFGPDSIAVSRLPGADVYMPYRLEGTLRCQTQAFVRTSGGVTLIKGPPSLEPEPLELCWTRRGVPASVFGKPAFVELGRNNQTTDDEDVRITPWTGQGWGQPCTLKLRFNTRFNVVERHCQDATNCTTLDRLVADLASTYDAFRQGEGRDGSFEYPGPRPPQALIQAANPVRMSTDSPDWPGFGDAKDERSVSYSGLAFVPLMVAGVGYVVAIGHEGVGWRETGPTLLIFYTPEDGALSARAAYAVDRSIAGLKSASAN